MDFECPWCGEEILDLDDQDTRVGVDLAPILRAYDRQLEAHVQEECEKARKELGLDHG